MEESNMNALLMDKLAELNEIEMNKAKVLTAIFQKTTHTIMERKVQSLQSNFEEQAKIYNQYLEDYDDIYESILAKYQEQLSQIIQKYNEWYINMLLELQEAECNQKIAITNLKKSYDIKQKLSLSSTSDVLEEYTKKIAACMQKKLNYDIIIEACEKEIDACSAYVESKINDLFVDQSTQISLKEENALTKFFNKVKNLFVGASKFNAYVVEPTSVELEMIENKLPDVMNEIGQETVTFVAKMRQAKDDTNRIFQNMI